MNRDLRRATLSLFIVLGVVVAVGAIFVLLGATHMSGNETRDAWFELFKAGLSLILVGFGGAVIGVVTARYNEAREAQRRLVDVRLRILHDIVRAYNEVKAVRRRLRAYGLRHPRNPLTPLQVEGLHREMSNLIDAQLSFEALTKEVVDSNAFDTLTDDFKEKLEGAEHYLNSPENSDDGVLGEWQKKEGASVVVAGYSDADFVGSFPLLQSFMARQAPGEGFDEFLTTPVHAITEAVQAQLYPKKRRQSLTLTPE